MLQVSSGEQAVARVKQRKRKSAPAQKWHPMRSALRTLTVLRALNIHNGATVGELSVVTGISRPALYRILETLREAGYISIDIAGKHYCLTMLVRSLAEGFSDEDWVTQIARPALARLQRKVVWPTDLGTFRSNGMWIRETTRRLSPLTIDRGVAGTRFSMLSSATGRAYLAFCRADEREQILRNLRLPVEPGNELILRPSRVEELLQDVRRRGYGYRFGEPPKESGAIAVPILCGERIFGCVNMTFMSATLTPDEAARKHLADLRETADAIANGTQKLETAASSGTSGKSR
jgi:IclR family transcriptional regulator, mhp operon transcriptional activator